MSEAICQCPRAEGCYACVRCRHTRCCVCDGHVPTDEAALAYLRRPVDGVIEVKTMVRWCRDWRCQREAQLESGVWRPGQSGWWHAFECRQLGRCPTVLNLRTDTDQPPVPIIACPICGLFMDHRGTWSATPSGHDPAAEVA